MADVAVEAQDNVARLSPKETACLRLVARHMSSKEIAAELGIAKTSVDTYCNRAREKLGATDRYEAARLVVARTNVKGLRIEGGWTSYRAAADHRALNETGGAAAARSLALGVGLAAALTLALATLLAGLRALDVMKPLPSAGSAIHALVEETQPR